MDYIVIFKVCLFLILGTAAYLMLSYLQEHKVLSSVADSVLERAKEQEADRQSEYLKLLLAEGRQEKMNLLYRLDLLVIQSNIRKYLPFMSTEIFLILVIFMAALGFVIGTYIFHTWIFGLIGFLAVCLAAYSVLYMMALHNHKKTEAGLMVFINLLENYSSTEDELVAIFSRIQPFLSEPIASAIDLCCAEAEITGNKSRAIRNLEKRIEHEKFKELIRNLEIASRYEANYAEIIRDSRSMLREYLAANKEHKAIINNARIEIAIIIGCCGLVFWMMSDFTEAGILPVLLGSMAGNIILVYCIAVILLAVWSVIFERH